MAQQINTDDEGEDSFNFESWITENDLNDIHDLLMKHKMTTRDALNINSSAFSELLVDPDFFAKGHEIATKLLTALQRVPATVNKAKMIRIYISKEEEEATKKLDEYHRDLLQLQTEISETRNLLIKKVKECDQNIQKSFKRLIDEINTKKQEMETKLKMIEENKMNQINAKSERINREEEKVKIAKNKCIELEEDIKINRDKRKHAIISMVDDILNNKLAKNTAKADAEVIFECDVDAMLAQDAFIDVYDPQKHPIPVIDHIECRDIAYTTATVHFSATLRDEDKNKKISSKLLMKLESAENKEEKTDDIEPIVSPIIFDKNHNINLKYKFHVRNLKQSRNYTMCLNLYQSTNKLNVAPHVIKFTTKAGGSFKYKSDFDSNGIIYAIGSNFGQKPFSNPHTQNLIKITSSEWEHGSVANIFGRRQQRFKCQSVGNENNWFMIDFGSKWKVKPTEYTLRHDACGRGFYLRNWQFEGSDDGKEWNLLKQHRNDTSLNYKSETKTWNVKCRQKYQMFRVYSTGFNSHPFNNSTLHCSGFEIYGDLREN